MRLHGRLAAAGVPLVTRDAPVLREVFGGAALFGADVPAMKATLGLALRLRNFRLWARLKPPMSTWLVASSMKKPTGLFCGAPPPSTVARRPSRWLRR